MTYTCACYPTDGLDAGAGAGAQVRPGRAQARAAPRGCGCWTSAAAGAAWSGTRCATTACPRSASRSRASRPPGPAGGSRPRGWPARPRCGTWTTATVTETGFDAVSSIGLIEHIGVKNYDAYFRFLRAKLRAGRPAAQPRHHPRGQPAPGLHRRGFIGRYVFPDGELTGSGDIVRAMRTPASRCSTRRTCACTTRRRSPRGAPTSSSTGTRRSPRPGCRSRRCGVSTWPAPGWGSSATRSSCTRSWPPRPRRTASRDYPLRHDFGV